jgi:hypothetical protein
MPTLYLGFSREPDITPGGFSEALKNSDVLLNPPGVWQATITAKKKAVSINGTAFLYFTFAKKLFVTLN